MQCVIIILCSLCLCLYPFVTSAQNQDKFILSSEFGPKSEELLDYYRFAGIDYFRMKAKGQPLADKHFMLIAKEYWDGKVTKIDTCENSRDIGIKVDTNDFNFSVIAQKENKNSVKFMFAFPRFHLYRHFKATRGDYSLRDPFNGKECEYSSNQPIMLLVYSLPYQNPQKPGWSSYCELSSTGVPPAEWGKKYGIKHHITFEIQFY